MTHVVSKIDMMNVLLLPKFASQSMFYKRCDGLRWHGTVFQNKQLLNVSPRRAYILTWEGELNALEVANSDVYLSLNFRVKLAMSRTWPIKRVEV